MKFVKSLSLVLALLLLCTAFISCDNTSEEIDVNLPEREFYEVTVSFQIKDSTGSTKIEAKDYKYKSHSTPTILNVLDTYLAVEKDWVCKIKENKNADGVVESRQITQIGGMKVDAKNGEYWGIVTNLTTKKNADGTQSVAVREGVSALNLSLEQINKQMNDEVSMDNTLVVDGAEFTVIQVVIED